MEPLCCFLGLQCWAILCSRLVWSSQEAQDPQKRDFFAVCRVTPEPKSQLGRNGLHIAHWRSLRGKKLWIYHPLQEQRKKDRKGKREGKGIRKGKKNPKNSQNDSAWAAQEHYLWSKNPQKHQNVKQNHIIDNGVPRSEGKDIWAGEAGKWHICSQLQRLQRDFNSEDAEENCRWGSRRINSVWS